MIGPWRARRRLRWETVGLIGALVAFVGFSLHFAFATQPLLPQDEHAHLAYGYAVADGQLPEIESWDRYPESADHMDRRVRNARDDRYRTVWVANHPPLYYVMLAPLLVATDLVGDADRGIMAGRLLNIAFATVGIALTYLLAVEVSGGVRSLGVLAAALVALTVQAQYTFAHAYNDGLALLTITLMAWAAVRCLRRAHPPGGALVLGLSIAAAAATRAVGLILGVVVIVTVVGARTLMEGRRVDRPAFVAAMHAAILAAPTVLLVGWFYVRNVVLYGDIGASSYLLERFDRVPREGGMVTTALDGHLWRQVYDRMVGYTRFSNPIGVSEWALDLWRWGALLAAVGLVVALVRGRAGGQRDDGRPAVLGRPGVVVLVLVAATNAAVYVQHVAGGGSPWPRYFYPTLGVMATLAAIGLHRLQPRVLPLLAVTGAAATCWVLARPTERLAGTPMVSPRLGTVSLALAAAGVVVVAGVLAWGVVARMLGLGRPPSRGVAPVPGVARPSGATDGARAAGGTSLAPSMTAPIGAR